MPISTRDFLFEDIIPAFLPHSPEDIKWQVPQGKRGRKTGQQVQRLPVPPASFSLGWEQLFVLRPLTTQEKQFPIASRVLDFLRFNTHRLKKNKNKPKLYPAV